MDHDGSCGIIFQFVIGNCDVDAVAELKSLKSRLDDLETDLKSKDEDIDRLKEQNNQLKASKDNEAEIARVRIIFPFVDLIDYLIFLYCRTHKPRMKR